MAVKDLTGSQDSDQMSVKNGKVQFSANNAGGITGGLATGQDIVVRLAVKPTPTLAKPRVWPVAEAFTAMILLDHDMQHIAFQAMVPNGTIST
jgi:chorismate synthase